MRRINPFAPIGFDDDWLGGGAGGAGGGGVELGEPGYAGRTADESFPGWTPNPQAFEPFNTYKGVNPYTGMPIEGSSDDPGPYSGAMMLGAKISGYIGEEGEPDMDPFVTKDPFINATWSITGSGEIPMDTDLSNWVERELVRLAELVERGGLLGSLAEVYLRALVDAIGGDSIVVTAKGGDVALAPGDSAVGTSPKVSAPPAPVTRDSTTPPPSPPPPTPPPSTGSASTTSPTGYATPFPTQRSAPPTRDSAFTASSPRSAGPSPASGEPAERVVSVRGQIIAPLPPISGSRDALRFNPSPTYSQHVRERGREAERKANPDLRDLHDIYAGLRASPLAALEDLVVGLINVPHEVVNRGTHAGEHIGRGYLLAFERGEYVEAYAEYLDAIIDLSVGFLTLASLGESGSAGKPPRASLGPELDASLPAATSPSVPARSTAGAARANDLEVFTQPGKWENVTRGDSKGLTLQAKWSARPYSFKGRTITVQEYNVQGLRFDRATFDEYGYLKSLDEFKSTYEGSIASGNRGVATGLRQQARAQTRIADELGVTLEWHVRKAEVEAFKKVLGPKLSKYITFVPYRNAIR